MAEKREPKPKTQKTPKGYEIPVPKRTDFERDLAKIAKSKPSKPGKS
jgi:hypothetical protein